MALSSSSGIITREGILKVSISITRLECRAQHHSKISSLKYGMKIHIESLAHFHFTNSDLVFCKF